MTSRSARYARNVGWVLAGQISAAVVNFLTVPFLVRRFGAELYGLYLLLPTIAGYISLTSLGAGGTTVHLVSESRAAGRGRALRQALRHSAAIHLGGAALGAVVLWIMAPFLAQRFFHASPEYRTNGIWLLRAAAAGGFWMVGTQWAVAGLQGLQRFDVQNSLSFVQSAAIPLGVAAALALGHGIGAASAWFVVAQTGVFILSAAALAHTMRSIPRDGGETPIREFVRESLGYWPGSFAWIVTYQLDRVFIARSLALDQLAYYSVPSNLLQRLQTFPASAASALVPVVGETGGDPEDLRRVYVRSVRILLGLLAPAYGLFFILMPQFLSLWLGGRFGDDSVWPARILVLGQASSVLLLPANAVIAGRGRGGWLSIVGWAQALMSLALWRLLIPTYGIVGSATASMIAQAVPTAACLHAVHSRLVHLKWDQYFWDALRPGLTAGAAGALVVFPLHATVSTWPQLLGLGALGLAVYAGVLWLRLPPQDREFALRGSGVKWGGA